MTLPEVVIRHVCNCKTANEHPPGGADVEHIFTVNGEDFPWPISERGPIVTKLDDNLFTVGVEIFARKVDAVGIEITSADA